MVAAMVVMLCANAAGEGEEYVLKPGDVISVDVVEHAEFSGRHKIRPDGRINYPVIGELDVAGAYLRPAGKNHGRQIVSLRE